MRLVLASASPRRRELLEAAGYCFDVRPVEVDERPRATEAPDDYVARLALAKARVAARFEPQALVLGADTTVTAEGLILGKPADVAQARHMLRFLAGRSHRVLTGVALVAALGEAVEVQATTVWFDALSDEQIAAYVETGEPFGKAGAYAIQGRASAFVTRLEGSYANVVGLPVAAVHRRIRAWSESPASD